MKTDELIVMLSTNVERVDRRQVARMVSAAAWWGQWRRSGSCCLRSVCAPTCRKPGAVAHLPLKLVFTVGNVVLTSLVLIKLARPGGERTTPIALVALPFVVIILFAAVSLAAAPSSYWNRMVVGDRWLECLLSIPIIAIVPFAAIIWAVRRMAPTDLVRTGAVAGLVAGARECDRLRASLHRRFAALRRALVRGHDRALHAGRRDVRAATLALVSRANEELLSCGVSGCCVALRPSQRCDDVTDPSLAPTHHWKRARRFWKHKGAER